MPILLNCLNASCGVNLKLLDESAGETRECPKCGTTFRVPTFADYKPAPPDDDDEPEPDDEPEDEPEWSGRHCYDCGCEIERGQVCRRTIVVGRTYIPGDGQPGHYGRVAAHFGRVDLCPRCYRRREQAEEEAARREEMFWVVVLTLFGLVLLAGASEAVFGMIGAILTVSLALFGLTWFIYVRYVPK